MQNLDVRPRLLRIQAPVSRAFSVRGGHTHTLAPGLSVTFEVLFNAQQLPADGGAQQQEHHAAVRIATQAAAAAADEPVQELWLHARPARPVLQLLDGATEGAALQFGVVAVGGAKAVRQLQLRNTGSAPAAFTVSWDK